MMQKVWTQSKIHPDTICKLVDFYEEDAKELVEFMEDTGQQSFLVAMLLQN